MVRIVLADNETLIKRARKNLTIAKKAGDAATTDLITALVQAHEKAAWMLRSTTDV